MGDLERLIATASELGSAHILKVMGISACEKSQRECRKIWGKWFADAVAAGRLRPVRVEPGRAGTKWFDVEQVLRLRTADAARCEAIFNNFK